MANELAPVPGEDRVRSAIADSPHWRLLFTDYVRDKALTVFYMETKIQRHFMNADDKKITANYLAIVDAKNDLIRADPKEVARRLIHAAQTELQQAVHKALSQDR